MYFGGNEISSFIIYDSLSTCTNLQLEIQKLNGKYMLNELN